MPLEAIKPLISCARGCPARVKRLGSIWLAGFTLFTHWDREGNRTMLHVHQPTGWPGVSLPLAVRSSAAVVEEHPAEE
ncbi:unnamed protein product [Nezara viridula]|uniref:Uncharacterized protein n=1 Tax=Nezara viridula TaxID=85310 RepID=A0A9P0H189_NEZVI|nr:unnamed protein product [Nezara viridula]